MLHMNSHTKGGGCGHKKGKRKSRISKGSVDNRYSYSPYQPVPHLWIQPTMDQNIQEKILQKVPEAKLELDTSFLCQKCYF